MQYENSPGNALRDSQETELIIRNQLKSIIASKSKVKNTVQALKYPSAHAVTLYARFQDN